ncbi:hypothetical protein NM688_g5705 [Phlebia brevispora]|uniref:Uncharacterized protein n=1 Tax=Phlebia brevispora TaxID=194682 RepID=A0ACC1SR44_9APHY|nr:hypothetical protein NM688_g5705 [Phlebia brevispora]
MAQLYSTQVLRTRVSHVYSVVRSLDSLWSWAGEHLISLSFGSGLAKAGVLRALSGIVHGKLTVETADGDVYEFGDARSPRNITLRVRNDAFWRRLLLFNDLGFAESYMIGEIDCDDMSALLQLVIANKQVLDSNLSGLTTYVLGLGRKLTEYKFLGDLSTSAANISAHYDLGNLIFQNTLSKDMNYSSAIFLDYKEDLVKAPELCETLESAQLRKMKCAHRHFLSNFQWGTDYSALIHRNLITRLNIQPGQRVLEIGTGWGALSILIAQTVDCTIDTVTLSGEQRDRRGGHTRVITTDLREICYIFITATSGEDMLKRPPMTLPLPRATLSALTQAGYSTAEDLESATPEILAKDARISLHSSQAVFSATQASRGPSFTQPASLLVQKASVKIPTLCPPLDSLLEGGLKRGSVLEISGPPGASKEALAVNLVKAILNRKQGTIFIDMQNMTTASQLLTVLSSQSALPPDLRQLVVHMSLYSLSELLVFLHFLPQYLQRSPKTELLVLNSLWFPFQSPGGAHHFSRTAAVDKTREALARACASTGLSVVITTQLATKLVKPDGSPANFDTGVRAIMVPQPGPAYLPPGRSHRVMIIPQTRTTGSVCPTSHVPIQYALTSCTAWRVADLSRGFPFRVLRLLSSPSSSHEQGQSSLREEPYELVEGAIQ